MRETIAKGFVWMDYMSVPQMNPAAQQMAIDSMPNYVRRPLNHNLRFSIDFQNAVRQMTILK